jgi:hypothetical protein
MLLVFERTVILATSTPAALLLPEVGSPHAAPVDAPAVSGVTGSARDRPEGD